MREPLPSFLDAFQIRVEIADVEPPVWRQIRVPVAISLANLHDVLQIAFGWQNSHLHGFEVDKIRFGLADVEDELFSVDERAAPLGAVARVGSKFLYRYDFGDDWEHIITVERLIKDGARAIECSGGARACPPEDSGGASGYAALLEALADPQHEEHDDMRRWVGRRFDPEKFDAVALNRKLATLSKKVIRQLRL
jgi:hypothetical protein